MNCEGKRMMGMGDAAWPGKIRKPSAELPVAVKYRDGPGTAFKFLKSYFRFTSEEPAINATTNSTRNTKNRIFAMDAAPAAMPVNPNNAATSATTRNMSDQRNIVIRF